MGKIRVFISAVILMCIVGSIAGCSGSSSIVPAAFSSETVQKMQQIVENTKSNYNELLIPDDAAWKNADLPVVKDPGMPIVQARL